MTLNLEYQKKNTYIFVFFYLCEGFSQGIPYLLWPQYLAQILGGSYNIPLWLVVYSIGTIPWSIKLIVGLFNDRWGSKKYGQRFPWIFSFGVFGGIWWIMMAFYLPTNDIYFWLAIYYFMTQLGMAFADTALDGLILDVTPKEKLARIQGYTWTVMFLGYGAGGMLLGLIFLATNLMPLLFILTGILMFISGFLPYFVKESPLKKISTKEYGSDLLTIVTKKRNWKVFLYTFIAAIPAVMIINFFMYVVLIAMGVIDVSSTILTIIGGGAVELQAWSSVFYLVNGVGIVIGSPISGMFGDRSRKKTLSYTFFAYIPFCLILVLPFMLVTGEILPLIFGMVFLMILGAIQNALTVVNQTIRGDLAKNYYPNLKSTFFAILVSLSNLGQNLGTIIGAGLFALFVLFTTEFYSIFFFVSIFCAICLIISYLIFTKIDPLDYELEKSLTKI
ncbi:MAG: MFS transporter [Candidatus Hermodarchaeota archaeon]